MLSKKKINVGVIGIGNMGRYHLQNYSRISAANLVAISDKRLELGREAEKKYNCRFFLDYKQMLKETDLDAVSIAVPTKFHLQVALDCIRFGKHILLEKPIASNVAEARKIIDAAQKAKVKLMIGHVKRFNPAVQTLKKIISNGDLGKIVSLVVRRVGVFPPQIKDSSVVVDLGVHDIDIFSYLMDKYPVSVFAHGQKSIIGNKEDSAEILLNYGDVSGFIQVNWVTPIKIRVLSATGLKGHAELNYITQKLEVYQSNYEKRVDNFGDFIVKFGEPVRKKARINRKEPLRCEIIAFLECICQNKEPEVTGEDGLRALDTANKAINSLINNKIIKI